MLCRSSFSKILIPRGLSRQYLRMSGGDSSVTRPPPQTERQAALRAEFLAREEEWEEGVVYSNLSEREKLIHEKHNQAVRDLHFTYDDPESGLKVLTRLRHFLKGTCCGNACRHCIYNHQNVDPILAKRKIFNTAFWIDNPVYDDGDDEDDNFFKT